jgi:NMD protein affecting ribosome stability and mRNA decay
MIMMKLSCDEATKICDKSQYGEATLWEKIKLNFHVFMCKTCGLYSKQNRIMTKCYEKHQEQNETEEVCLKPIEKKDMKEELIEKM